MFRYRYDTETGLYYLQSRYYNPEWGRFINADGIIGQTGELLGHNLFVYTKNNPVNMSDKSGFRPIYTVGDETDEMMEASVAVGATAARNKVSSSKDNIRKAYESPLIGVSKALSKSADDYMSDAIKARNNKIVKYYYDTELALGLGQISKSVRLAGAIPFSIMAD